MITLYKRGGVYYLESNLAGDRKRWSLKTRDRVVADALRRQAELDILGCGQLRPKMWAEFQEEFLQWIEPQVRWSTLKGYRFVVKKFGVFMATNRIIGIREITPATISKYVDERRRDVHPSRKTNVAEGGIKFDLRILHRLFSYAIDCEYISKNPIIVRNLNSTPGKTVPFSQDEIDKMFADKLLNETPYLRALVLVFLYTGLRTSDVANLRKEAVQDEKLVIRTQKRSRDVTLHIHENVAEAIEPHLNSMNDAQKKSPLIFPSETGAPNKSLDKMLRRLFVRAGITGGHPHRFRDTYAVRLLSKGASIYDVAKLMGIGVQTAERHYAPYCEELRKRGAEIVKRLDFVT